MTQLKFKFKAKKAKVFSTLLVILIILFCFSCNSKKSDSSDLSTQLEIEKIKLERELLEQKRYKKEAEEREALKRIEAEEREAQDRIEKERIEKETKRREIQEYIDRTISKINKNLHYDIIREFKENAKKQERETSTTSIDIVNKKITPDNIDDKYTNYTVYCDFLVKDNLLFIELEQGYTGMFYYNSNGDIYSSTWTRSSVNFK